jgi:hypothetical protein
MHGGARGAVRRAAKVGGQRIRAAQTSETQSGAWRPSRAADFMWGHNFVYWPLRKCTYRPAVELVAPRILKGYGIREAGMVGANASSYLA